MDFKKELGHEFDMDLLEEKLNVIVRKTSDFFSDLVRSESKIYDNYDKSKIIKKLLIESSISGLFADIIVLYCECEQTFDYADILKFFFSVSARQLIMKGLIEFDLENTIIN